MFGKPLMDYRLIYQIYGSDTLKRYKIDDAYKLAPNWVCFVDYDTFNTKTHFRVCMEYGFTSLCMFCVYFETERYEIMLNDPRKHDRGENIYIHVQICIARAQISKVVLLKSIGEGSFICQDSGVVLKDSHILVL